MRKIAVTIVVLSFVLINLASSPHAALAAFSNVGYSFTCSSASVQGTSSKPTWFGPNTIWLVVYDFTVNNFVVSTNVATDASGNFSYQTTFPTIPKGDNVVLDIWDGNGLDRLVNTTSCSQPYAGPPIPSGFVLRTITCDTAVFDAAGGQPLASGEKIKAGQTWFVSPKSVKDAQGKSWTEIFNSGVLDGFIWSSCVAGAPAGYTGN